ncbi:NAD(P)/FAD-dependent oxidoreductase [Gordonia sp. TBRC 11910]|uniref:NAD(P)/FAD-dependent oxidoreductase n=1 Tax=Gordonia asplenii TaxID=2725283 RepID=A0A848L198_9ACTN|nr:NAD(P)/FAD-dependent oxidoreductase [Gordonia asplenii]NMO02393.1 NAD(P)/FAD-dependent oxidoreductase [Gordonia asplenii]
MTTTATKVKDEPASTAETWSEILVVGAGFSGICAGIKLLEAGFSDFVIVERADDVGGTWRQNHYPGLEVDVPSIGYSYSFEHRVGWKGPWAPQPDVLKYAQNTARKYGLTSHLRYNKTVVEARFDDADNVWTTCFADGSVHRSRYVISGTGLTSTANWPKFEGIETFRGELVHTTEWPDDYDMSGKRIAIIGTGATCIQLAPELAKVAGKLSVFQRTPIWVSPKPGEDHEYSKPVRFLLDRVPGVQLTIRLIVMGLYAMLFHRAFTHYWQIKPVIHHLEKLGKANIAKVDNPEWRAALTPDYELGCKRPAWSNSYYPMFNRDNVELVTSSITKITEHGIVTADGVEHPIDVLICATGQQPFGKDTMPTFPTHGLDGKELRHFWDVNRHQGVKGIAVNGFPNFFLVFGPHGSFAGSIIAMIEIEVTNIVTALKVVRERGANRIEADPEAQRKDFEKNNRLARKGSILFQGNCATANTYYIDRHGDTPMARQTNQWLEWWRMKRLAKGDNMSAFNITKHSSPVPPRAARDRRTRVKVA